MIQNSQVAPAAPPEIPPGQKPTGQPTMPKEPPPLVVEAMKVIYDKQGAKQLVQIMQKSADPAAGVAVAATIILARLKEVSKMTTLPNFIYAIVVVFLVDLGKAAGLFKADKELVQKAVQILGQHNRQQAKAPAQPAGAPPMQPQGPQRGLIGSVQPQMGA